MHPAQVDGSLGRYVERHECDHAPVLQPKHEFVDDDPAARLNWTKVGLKVGDGDHKVALSRGLNWTKVGLKEGFVAGNDGLTQSV